MGFRYVVVAFALSVVGCGEETSPWNGSSANVNSAPLDDDSDATLCVRKINEYRATVNLPALARWTDGEACANEQAASDAKTKKAHGAFGTCSESAQNECPGWPGPPAEMIGNCLDMMWDEGPGGGHYDNMASKKYTRVACGFAVADGNQIWAIQNFR